MTDTSYSSLWLFEKKGIRDLNGRVVSIRSLDMVKGRNYSEFNPTVAGKIIRYWSDEWDTILDPFAGRMRGAVAMFNDRCYLGFEVSKEAYDAAYKVINAVGVGNHPQPVIHCDDSFNLDKYELPEADMVFTCPPYWNLELYESCEGQLSDYRDYPSFLSRLKAIFQKSASILKHGGFFVIVVGDWREDGRYIPFHRDCINMLEGIGLELWDIIINQSVTFDIACRRFGRLKRVRKTSKVHEYILVFQKTNPKLDKHYRKKPTT